MPSIEEMSPKKGEKGKRWRARYRTPEGIQRKKTFAKKVDAERFVTRIEGSKLEGTYAENKDRITFETYAEQWRGIQVHRPSTASQVETNLRRHVYPTLGNRQLHTIRRSEIQSLVTSLSKDLAPGTVELIYGYIATIFKAAVLDRLIAVTPCVKVAIARKAHRAIVIPTAEEIESIIEALPARYRALGVLAAGTGLRPGECLGLTVDSVVFLGNPTVTVDRQLLTAPGSEPVFGPPKTESSNRVVPMPGVVHAALSAHLAEFGEGPDRLVFTDERGRAIRRNRLSEVFGAARKRSKVRPEIRLHEFRHFYASALIHYGESVKVVQARLGHKTAQETLDTYSHVWPDTEDRTRAAVDSVLTFSRVPSLCPKTGSE